jgi:hypothetical protein
MNDDPSDETPQTDKAAPDSESGASLSVKRLLVRHLSLAPLLLPEAH